VNGHAKSRLTPEPLTGTPARRQGPGRSLPGPDAGHPLHPAAVYDKPRRLRGCGPSCDGNPGNQARNPERTPGISIRTAPSTWRRVRRLRSSAQRAAE